MSNVGMYVKSNGMSHAYNDYTDNGATLQALFRNERPIVRRRLYSIALNAILCIKKKDGLARKPARSAKHHMPMISARCVLPPAMRKALIRAKHLINVFVQFFQAAADLVSRVRRLAAIFDDKRLPILHTSVQPIEQLQSFDRGNSVVTRTLYQFNEIKSI
ncbi:hypothetical protein BLX87_12925 [Bacillus sp. VT-16-64]|nr:hypothetical protein BLX87_12925 [Bacillus sp. VT-16-64]